MKKILLASTLALCVTSAFAADPSAVLKVKGTLTNAACTPELSNGGVVDYGMIRLGELSATATNQLGQKNIDLTINCASSTKVGFQIVDDRSSSDAYLTVENAYVDGSSASLGFDTFGVGKTDGDVKIGSWALGAKTDSILADGNSVDFITSPDWTDSGAPSWKSNASQGLLSPTRAVYSVAATGTLEPVAFKSVTFPLQVSLAIQNTATLAITDDTAIDGQATITLKYL
ncbi:TPA: DUF1120 domain-containing protein [Enterobacter hormaechei]|uniref:DUF1120 domain-containing protein n=1 Tax=Enterobacter hormaechei TaxID=158836 RepID=UPI002889DE3A|nr:DUF1120 domain-containing protein [Enterobacter hormaechei]EKS6647351.1 DUF1120 domain-containing protein [Enterobacter hormaechei]WNJ35771.1 DUF1120 domain-containing protein [Enterobacter hormaechei subsp. hormaechei]HDR1955715.1 DUF1120 domain-containing protein [Enterobacter hormaechei]